MKNYIHIIKLYSSLLILLSSFQLTAQVGIGTETPDASSALEISATDKGFLMPRMTTAQRTAIVTPATGLKVYDTDTNSFWYFNGTEWTQAVTNGEWGDGTEVAGIPNNATYLKRALVENDTVIFYNDGRLILGNIPTNNNSLLSSFTHVSGDNNSKKIGVSGVAENPNGDDFQLMYGGYFSSRYTGTGNVQRTWGIDSFTTAQEGTGTVETLYGAQLLAGTRDNFTGQVDRLAALNAVANPTVGTVTDVFGVRITGFGLVDPNVPGLNRYGLWINNVVPSTIQSGGEAFAIRTGLGLVSLGDNVEQRGTGYMKVATGTTTERPSSAEAGMIRFNTTTNTFEGYDGTNWVNLN